MRRGGFDRDAPRFRMANRIGERLLSDRELFAIPRAAMLRSIMLNHWYHHRGQLTAYLRELDVPIPSIYGPSADENPFA